MCHLLDPNRLGALPIADEFCSYQRLEDAGQPPLHYRRLGRHVRSVSGHDMSQQLIKQL